VAAVLLPLLVIGGGMPFWIACIISAAAGGGLVVLFSPRKLFEQLDLSGGQPGQDRIRARTPDRRRAACEPP